MRVTFLIASVASRPTGEIFWQDEAEGPFFILPVNFRMRLNDGGGPPVT